MATANIKAVITADDRASATLGKFGDNVSGLAAGVGAMARTAAIALGAVTAAAATAGVTVGIGFNNSVEQAQTKLMAFMKDGEKVAQTLAWVKNEAAKTQFSFTDMANAAANLTPVAKTSGKSLESLVQQAEILAAINPAEGLTGAVFSLREALSGDWVSITDRFNLPRKRINELKEQGVPAMEIISRTLNEMGIDYGLVAAQGKTLSARFDQVKDKLVMMAGAATKPVFDRLSQEFDKIGQIDFVSMGENMSGFVGGAITLFDRWATKMQEVGKQIGNYLGPKLQALADKVIEVWPTFDQFRRDVLEPLAYVVGTVLVVAIGFLIDALSKVIEWSASAYRGVREGIGRFREALEPGFNWFLLNIWPTLQRVGEWIKNEFKASWDEFKKSWDKVSEVFERAGIKIDGVQIALVALSVVLGLLLAPIIAATAVIVGLSLAIAELTRLFSWLTGTIVDFSVRAAGKIYEFAVAGGRFISSLQDRFDQFRDAVFRVWNFVSTLDWGRALGGIAAGIGNAIIGKIEGAINGALKGLPGSPKVGIPRFARGTNFAPGGLAIVGEEGPELVNLPRGSQVKPANQTRDLLGKTPSPVSTSQPTINITIQAGAFVGSQIEARKFATMIMSAYNDAMAARGAM